MKVVGELGESMPIETAYCAANIGQCRGPAMTFPSVVAKVELPDLGLCIRRRLAPVGKSADLC
jgi:hypothetical protein